MGKRFWKQIVLTSCLGLLSAFPLIILLREFPIEQNLETEIIYSYFRIRGTKIPPKNIVLIRQKDREEISNIKFDIPYTALVKRIVSFNPAGVIINPDNGLHNCLPELHRDLEFINLLKNKKIRDKVIIGSYPYSTVNKHELISINKCLPIDPINLSPLVKTENIQGFFEFVSLPIKDSKYKLIDYDYVSEKELSIPFACTKSVNECLNYSNKKRFKSIIYLGFVKFSGSKGFPESRFINYPSSIKPERITNFFGTAKKTFDIIYIDDYKNIDDIPKDPITGKIVIIDIPQIDSHNILLNTPFDQISVSEAQASLLSTLLTDSFYYKVNPLSILIISLVVVVGISIFIVKIDFSQNKISLITNIIVLLTTISLFYILFSITIFYTHRLIFQIATPIITWYMVGSLLGVWSWLRWRDRKYMEQQQLLLNLETEKSLEREALLNKIQDFLTISFSKIHEKPLQYLRVVMDDIEILEFKETEVFNRYPQLKTGVEKLRILGTDIRDYFDSILTLISQVDTILYNISPHLESGLKNGIIQHIDELKQNNELSIDIIQDIDEVPENIQCKTWLSQREEIFRFFKEAVRNVIKHSQFPNGEAKTLFVSLKHAHDYKYFLIVENDGCQKNIEDTDQSLGYGSKDMSAIARKLPQGKWERVFLPCGRVRVTLSWLISASNYNFEDMA